MKLYLAPVILLKFIQVSMGTEFPLCSNVISNGTICVATTVDTDISYPPWPWPLVVRPTMYLRDISNVNEELKTVTLNFNNLFQQSAELE